MNRRPRNLGQIRESIHRIVINGTIMKKRVLDVGNCGADHQSLRRLVEGRFGAELRQAHDWLDAARHLAEESFDLVLVNRLLDRDGSEGLDVIRQIKADDRLRDLPVMMITNYEEHQHRAVEAGAVHGFGKNALGNPQTVEKLSSILGS